MSRRMMVIGAHAADFVWRAGGVIARTTQDGGEARVVALTYGERGESGELWKEPGQTEERVKELRHAEAEQAAAALGAGFTCLDLGDYPLEVDKPALQRLADAIREYAPDTLITHTGRDPFNPDHPLASQVVERARSLAAGSGVASAFETITPPGLLHFEPHQPDLCDFTPNVLADITAAFEAKQAAMAAMQSQKSLIAFYAHRAEQRGSQARRISGRSEIRYAEAFHRVVPNVVDAV